MKYTPENIFK